MTIHPGVTHWRLRRRIRSQCGAWADTPASGTWIFSF